LQRIAPRSATPNPSQVQERVRHWRNIRAFPRAIQEMTSAEKKANRADRVPRIAVLLIPPLTCGPKCRTNQSKPKIAAANNTQEMACQLSSQANNDGAPEGRVAPAMTQTAKNRSPHKNKPQCNSK